MSPSPECFGSPGESADTLDYSINSGEVSVDLDNLKAMIRQFVALDKQNLDDGERQRLLTNVLKISSYRLPRSASNVCTNEERQKILKRCKRDWTTNESMWKEEGREQSAFTRCKVRRTQRGYVEYNDAETGNLVDADEYAGRIMEFNEINKAAKRLKRTLSETLSQQSSQASDCARFTKEEPAAAAVVRATGRGTASVIVFSCISTNGKRVRTGGF